MNARAYSTVCLLVTQLGCPRPPGSSAETETGDADTQVGSSESESTDHAGSESSDSTGDEVDECVPSLYEDCWAEAEAALVACVQACDCGDLECGSACYQDHETAHWACIPDEVESMCDESFAWRPIEHCNDACEVAVSSCMCDANACAYVGYACSWKCRGCAPQADFMFPYAEGCELTLPGPLDPVNLPFTGVEVGDQQFLLSDPQVASCDDPSNPGFIWLDDAYDGLLLCPAVCEAFAEVGEVMVEVGTPPCE